MAGRDITGQIFGRLTAVKPLRSEPRTGVIWLCRCSCGVEKEAAATLLRRGKVRSCGCLAKEQKSERMRGNITGERFGYLTAVSPTQQRDSAGSIVWECRCRCGNVSYHSVNALRKGTTRSCGCLYRESRSDCVNNRKDYVDNTALSNLVAAKELRMDNTSGHTGVYLQKSTGKWMAYINFQHKRFYLGTYSDINQAVAARQSAERQLHDPVIMERFGNLTTETRKKFMAYLRDAVQAEAG